jgi:hypothetical protein
MPIAINGSGTLTGISVGGLPDGIVDADMLASNAVTAGKLASGVGGKVINYAQTLKKDVTSAVVAQGAISGALISLSYAAASSSNKLLLSYTIHIGLNTSTNCYGYLYIDGSVSSIIGDAGESNQKRATSTSQGVASHKAMIHSFQTLIDNPSTSSTTYDVRFGHGNNSNQTMFINNDSQNGNYNYYARFVSSLTILEVSA